MPSWDFYIKNKKQYEFDDRYLFFDSKNEILRLRKSDSNLKFDPDGYYPVSGIVVFPNHKGDSITELFSFEESVSESSSGTIDYQLSNDNGSHWYYVSSSGVWTLTSTNFSDDLDISGNLGYFPLKYPKQVRIKARLRPPTARKNTPELLGVSLNFEHDAEFIEDSERSLKRFLSQRFVFKDKSRFKVTSGLTSYKVQVDAGSLYSLDSVYNIDSDVNRQTNLIISFTSDGTFRIPSQLSGTLEVKHKNTLPIILNSDLDTDKSRKSCIKIKRYKNSERKQLRFGDDVEEICKSRMIARVRPHPEIWESDFTIICEHGNNQQSTEIADAINKIVSSQKIITSVGTGRDYRIRIHEPVNSTDYDIFSNLVRVTMTGYNDVVKFDRLTNPSGSELPDEFTYIGSGTEDRFDVVPLIKESGVIFNVRKI